MCACGCNQPAPIAKQSNKKKGITKGEPLKFIIGHQNRKHPFREIDDGVKYCKCGCQQIVPPAKKSNGKTQKGERPDYVAGHFPRVRYGELADRFWSKVDIRGADECWPWIAAVSPKRYGIFRMNGRMHPAHRIAFILDGGVFTKEKPFGCHRCNCASCVNPKHIYAGDAQDNANDMVACGHISHASQNVGASNGMTKFADEDVLKIRALRKAGLTNIEIAAMYKVSEACICNICRRKTWKHLPEK